MKNSNKLFNPISMIVLLIAIVFSAFVQANHKLVYEHNKIFEWNDGIYKIVLLNESVNTPFAPILKHADGFEQNQIIYIVYVNNTKYLQGVCVHEMCHAFIDNRLPHDDEEDVCYKISWDMTSETCDKWLEEVKKQVK